MSLKRTISKTVSANKAGMTKFKYYQAKRDSANNNSVEEQKPKKKLFNFKKKKPN